MGIDIGPFKKETCHILFQAAGRDALLSNHPMLTEPQEGALWALSELGWCLAESCRREEGQQVRK